MKKPLFFKSIVIVVLVVAVAFVCVFYFNKGRSRDSLENSISKVVSTPEIVVADFLNWYISDTGGFSNLNGRSDATTRYKKKIEEKTRGRAKDDFGWYDPVVFPQDLPNDFTFGTSTINNNTASLNITLNLLGKPERRVSLVLDSESWKIDDITILEKENRIHVGQALGSFTVNKINMEGEDSGEEMFDIWFDGETEIEGEYFLLSSGDDYCSPNYDNTSPYGYSDLINQVQKGEKIIDKRYCKMDQLFFKAKLFDFNTKYNTYSLPLSSGFIYFDNQDVAKKILLGKKGLATIKINKYRTGLHYTEETDSAVIVSVASSTVLLGLDKE